jgi:hypothetical protein
MSLPSHTLRAVLGAFAALALLGALAAGSATAERASSGNLIASLSGEIRPHSLPRLHSAPIAIDLSSDFSTTDGSRLPQLRRISIAVGNRGQISRDGLPVCKSSRLRATTWEQSLQACEPAIVGHGHLDAKVAIGSQKPFAMEGRIVAYNGTLKDGRLAVLADVHSEAPPVSFTMPFVLGARKGRTLLSAKLPEAAAEWAHVTHFDLTLERRYSVNGERRSFLSGRCAVPKGFTGIVFPLAAATYNFAGGRRVVATATRGCSVRK